MRYDDTLYLMTFKRKQKISKEVTPKRVLVIYGPRRVGKTTLLNEYIQTQTGKKVFYSTGDDINLRKIFQSEERATILDFARPYELVAVDEAQYIPSIGIGAKMMIDAFPEKNIILTGSSSLDLSNKIGEPLTGRHFTMTLLPFSQGEIAYSRVELQWALEGFLVYGSYPEVLNETDVEKKKKILTELITSYLFKDALALEAVRSPDTLLNIAKCLAFQIGNEVSINEVAQTAGTDTKTTAKYLDLLEKMFVIKKVRGFSRNLRTEISKKAKYYFLDNGVRNAVISQFNPLSLRDDIGALWENFIFMELVKKSSITGAFDNYYFWRTHAGKEIDIIRESNGVLLALECKWSSDKAVKVPEIWKEAYPGSTFQVIDRNNYLDFLL